MLDFSILYGIILFISLTSQLSVNKKFYFITCILILTFMSAFRGPAIGNDTHEYIRIFEQIDDEYSEHTRYEKGYLWLNLLLQYISDNYQILFIVSSIFIYFSVGRFIWKYSSYPLLSVILFLSYGFYSFTFTAIRQGIALAILLFSFDYILKGQFWKFLLLIIISTMFHSTAALFIIAYFARYLKPSLKTFLIFAICAIIGLWIFSSLLDYAFRLFPVYRAYINKSYVGDAGLANVLYITLSSIILIFSYKSITSSGPTQKLITVNDTSMIMLLFAVVFYILSLKANILDRVALYFNFYSIILLPNALKNISPYKRVPVVLFIILFFYVYSIVILKYRPGWNSVFPYSFC